MYVTFKDFGEIAEVIIPSKRDKRGKRFGFSRIFNVRDKIIMATKIDNILIGSRKIHANVPRFNIDMRMEGGKMKGHAQGGRNNLHTRLYI